MAATDRQRWARVPPHLARKRPGLPTEWTRVLERNPDAMNPKPVPGYVWLDTLGKVLHVEAARLEFRRSIKSDRPAADVHPIKPPPRFCVIP